MRDCWLPGDLAPGRPARRRRDRRLLPGDGLQLQPRAAPAGGRRSATARAALVAAPRDGRRPARASTPASTPTGHAGAAPGTADACVRCPDGGWNDRPDIPGRDLDDYARRGARASSPSPCSAAARSAARWPACCASRADDLAARVGRPLRAGRRRRARRRAGPATASTPALLTDDLAALAASGRRRRRRGHRRHRAGPLADPRRDGGRRRRSSPPTRRCSPRTARTLHAAAEKHGVDLYYEAVGRRCDPAAAPAARESLAGDKVRRVLGIVNGTTNFILTKMDEDGADYDDVLAEAQALGYAEADPTADVEGYDAAAKAAILAGLAFHTRVTVDDVHREGITAVVGARRRRRARHGLRHQAARRRRARRRRARRRSSACTRRWSRAPTRSPACAAPSTPCSSRPSRPASSCSTAAAPAVRRRRPPCSATSWPSRGTGSPARAGRGSRRTPTSRCCRIGDAVTRYYVNLDVADRPGVLAAVAPGVRRQRRQHPERAPGRPRRRGRPGRAHPRRHRRRARRRPSSGCGRPTPCATSSASCGSRGRTVDERQPGSATSGAGSSRSTATGCPSTDATPVVTPARGRHAARRARACCRERTGCEVWLKVEGANPTGSFKDRGMTMAISKAAEEGAKAVICASTGNTSRLGRGVRRARPGMVCAVLVPQGKIALGKMAQALVHGAQLLQVDGNFDDCLTLARKLSEHYPVSLVNSVNPFRIEGQKTGGVRDRRLPRRRPRHPLPARRQRGQHHRVLEGLRRVRRRRHRDAAPARCGASRPPAPRRSSTARRSRTRRRSRPRSASATPRRGTRRVAARDESGGLIDAVTDREILVGVPAARRARRACSSSRPRRRRSPACCRSTPRASSTRARRVVCTVTGNGLKDPEWAIAGAPKPTQRAPSTPTRQPSAAGSRVTPPPSGRPMFRAAADARARARDLGQPRPRLRRVRRWRSRCYDDVVAQVSDDAGVRVDVHGEGADTVPRDHRHLVAKAMLRGVRRPRRTPARPRSGVRQPHPARSRPRLVGGGDRLRPPAGPCTGRRRRRAPARRGAARAGERRSRGTPTTSPRACTAASRSPGPTHGEPHAGVLRARAPTRAIVPVVCVPSTAVATKKARGLLPETVPHGDAACNAARAALLVPALTGRLDLLLEATDDRIHQSYRRAGVPAHGRPRRQAARGGHRRRGQRRRPHRAGARRRRDRADASRGWRARGSRPRCSRSTRAGARVVPLEG